MYARTCVSTYLEKWTSLQNEINFTDLASFFSFVCKCFQGSTLKSVNHVKVN